MAVQAFVAEEVLGWKLDSKKTHAIIGLKSGGGELHIAVAEKDLWDVITGLVDASAAFPLEEGFKRKKLTALGPTSFEVGEREDSKEFALSAFFPSKGHLTFHLSRELMEALLIAVEHTLSLADKGRKKN